MAFLSIRRRRRFILLTERDQFRGSDDIIESGKVIHSIVERFGAAMSRKRTVKFTCYARQCADDPAGENHKRISDRLQIRSPEQRSLATLDHVRHERDVFERRRNTLKLGTCFWRLNK